MSNKTKKMLEEYVKGLFDLVGDKLKQVILYGSYARGDQNQNGEISDIDIMILVNTNEEEIRKIQKQVLDYSYDFDLQYDVLLSPIIENVDNFNSKIKYISFYQNVQKEGILLNG